MNNIITETDSYKFGSHFNMYLDDVSNVYSYFEARGGAKYPKTLFFGLQYILKRHLVGRVVTKEKIDFAEELALAHLGSRSAFNRAGWEVILNEFDGHLPLKIKAIKEGTVLNNSNALITVELTKDDKRLKWLTNYVETVLSRTWYPATVGTISYNIKQNIKEYLQKTGGSLGGLDFMLHGFGYRSASSEESACIADAAHLVNFLGTDTIGAMELLAQYYNAPLTGLAYSVPASEHSVMTVLGKEGESDIVGQLLDKYPSGILSVVADSYNIYNFVSNIVGEAYKERIMSRPEGSVFVIRPDSVTPTHPTPEAEMVWIAQELWDKVGGTINDKGFKVINPKIRILWGDGINAIGIRAILENLYLNGFAAENVACFGCGSNMVHTGFGRDTQRFAFKCSAQKRDGVWYDIMKSPLDASKKSKAGRLKVVINSENQHETVSIDDPREDELVEVFNTGKLIKEYTLAEVRELAKTV